MSAFWFFLFFSDLTAQNIISKWRLAGRLLMTQLLLHVMALGQGPLPF